jgi:hypothetical protein
LTFDPGAAFRTKIIEFDARTVKSQDSLGKLDKQAKEVEMRIAAVEGRSMALERAARLIGNRSPDITDRLAAYFGEAVRYVVGAAILCVVAAVLFISMTIFLMVKAPKH